jgi:hypothetical protein
MSLEHLKRPKPGQPGKWGRGQGPPQPRPAKNTGRERRINKGDYVEATRGVRLPPGSSKSLRWDGELWHLIMTIPGYAEPFVDQGRSEFEVLHLVHQKFAATAERISKGLDL